MDECTLFFLPAALSLLSQLSHQWLAVAYEQLQSQQDAFNTCPLSTCRSDPAPHRHFAQVHVREAHSGQAGEILHEERL